MTGPEAQIGQKVPNRTRFGRAVGLLQCLAQASRQGRLGITSGPAAQQRQFRSFFRGQSLGIDRLPLAQLQVPGVTAGCHEPLSMLLMA